MRTVVYADVLLAVNWVIDYFLLLGVAAVTGVGVRRGRLLAGGALGALSTLVFLAPALPLWLQLGYQAVTGSAVLAAAFARRMPLRRWLRQLARLWLWYFLFNAGYSGLVLAAMYWLSFGGVRQNNLAFYFDVSPQLLAGCILALYAFVRLLLLLFERPGAEKIVRVQASAAGQTLTADVLVDSGFTGADALTAQPLLLLSYPDTVGGGAARGALDTLLRRYYGQSDSAEVRSLPQGLRLTPLHTAGGEVLAPSLTAQAVINGRPAAVTLAFSDQRFRAGQVQGLFGAKSYEMIGGN